MPSSTRARPSRCRRASASCARSQRARPARPARQPLAATRDAVAQDAVAQLGAGAVETRCDGSADCGAAPCPACSPARSRRWRGAANNCSGRGSTRANWARWRRRSLHALGETAAACGARNPAIWASKLGAHRHRQFGGGGGRGRAHVGGEIDQGGVGLMPHRRDQRDDAGRRGAHHRFLIEGHQIFDRAAAPRHDDQIGPRQMLAVKRIEAGDGGGDFGRRLLALHRHRPEQHPARESAHSAGA